MSPSNLFWNDLARTEAGHQGLQILCTSKPPLAPWESWSSRLFGYEQPNSPATPSENESATYFTEASQLPAEAYLCPEAYTQEAFIDVESQYCSEEDADKQDLQYRLLVGGLRSSRRGPAHRLGSKKQIGKQAKLTRKPSKTRYAFQNIDPARPPKEHGTNQAATDAKGEQGHTPLQLAQLRQYNQQHPLDYLHAALLTTAFTMQAQK